MIIIFVRYLTSITSFNTFNSCSDFNILQCIQSVMKVFGQDMTMQKDMFLLVVLGISHFPSRMIPTNRLKFQSFEPFANNNEHV